MGVNIEWVFGVAVVCLWIQIGWFRYQTQRTRKLHKELLELQKITLEWVSVQKKFFEAARHSNVEVAEHWWGKIQEIETQLIAWNKHVN